MKQKFFNLTAYKEVNDKALTRLIIYISDITHKSEVTDYNDRFIYRFTTTWKKEDTLVYPGEPFNANSFLMEILVNRELSKNFTKISFKKNDVAGNIINNDAEKVSSSFSHPLWKLGFIDYTDFDKDSFVRMIDILFSQYCDILSDTAKPNTVVGNFVKDMKSENLIIGRTSLGNNIIKYIK